MSTIITTSKVVMIAPDYFNYNPQTAGSNSFQHLLKDSDLKLRACSEFYNMISSLQHAGIEVINLPAPVDLPDAVFPNNWFTSHCTSRGHTNIYIYPLLSDNRQQEVNINGLVASLKEAHIKVDNTIDLRTLPFGPLEGTGSLVFDRNNLCVYAALSARTNENMVRHVARLLDYQPVIFNSADSRLQPIYHTNVMLSIAEQFAIVCLKSIYDKTQRQLVIETLEENGKTIIDISFNQLEHMCGNVLELHNQMSDPILIMSYNAYHHFAINQLNRIEQYCSILPVNIATIEHVSGGSARCMMAEIFADIPEIPRKTANRSRDEDLLYE